MLEHYKAVVWYTGDDQLVREPGQPGGTGTAKLLDDEVIATRDFMNEGGKLLVTGKFALYGAWNQYLYNPLGPTPPKPFCASNFQTGQGALADDPPGQNFNCVIVSNDFNQYWLGAYLPISLSTDTQMLETPLLGTAQFGLNGTDSAANQNNLYSLLTTSSILPADQYPQFKSEQAIKVDGPPAFDPPTGSQYVYSQQANSSYKRLTRTVDLTGKSSGALSFKVSYDTEAGFDYVFVEAHTVGADDWTTLPDTNGNTDTDTGHRLQRPEQHVLAGREPVPQALHHAQRRSARHLHRDGLDGHVERGDRELGRVPGLERRPDPVRGQAGRAVDHLCQRPRHPGPGRVHRRHDRDRRRRDRRDDVVRGRARRLGSARLAA